MADPTLIEAEDDKGRDGGVADYAEREGQPWTQRFAGDQRAAGRLAAGGDALGQPRCDQCGKRRRRDREGPDEVVAAGAQEQIAHQRAEGEAGPDRQPVEADHAAAPILGGHVDDPGRAGGEHRSLTGADEQARDDQAGDAGGEEEQYPGDHRQDGADDHGHPPAAPVGEIARDRTAEDAGEGERPR